ncbi:hypothetical protein HRbin02_01323 [Candidatus Calditenuaceae archaeon HR02]|nr:hypothetical protein HRbin02_01323 [Candidatus Calditenuaceae archaeon HR02]
MIVMRCGVRLNSRGRSEHVMSGLVCGLDVHKRFCDATLVDWFGNVVESRRLPRNELWLLILGRLG